MKDTTTRTEADAAKADRAAAWDDRERDFDEPGDPIEASHDCTYAPFADDCLGCLVWERHWIKERAAVDAANDKEWFA